MTAHRQRVRRMLPEVGDTVRSFSRAERDSLAAELVVAVAWESAFLADPSCAVEAHVRCGLPELRATRISTSARHRF